MRGSAGNLPLMWLYGSDIDARDREVCGELPASPAPGPLLRLVLPLTPGPPIWSELIDWPL